MDFLNEIIGGGEGNQAPVAEGGNGGTGILGAILSLAPVALHFGEKLFTYFTKDDKKNNKDDKEADKEATKNWKGV